MGGSLGSLPLSLELGPLASGIALTGSSLSGLSIALALSVSAPALASVATPSALVARDLHGGAEQERRSVGAREWTMCSPHWSLFLVRVALVCVRARVCARVCLRVCVREQRLTILNCDRIPAPLLATHELTAKLS